MRTPRKRQRGFTLMEILIALAVMSIVMGGILTVFDQTNRLARLQVAAADMNQSSRVAHGEIVRMLRMAGRPGLGNSRVLNGPSILVQNSVGAGTEIAPGVDDSPLAIQGTDILTIRGVITTPLFNVDYLDNTTASWDPDTGEGRVRVDAVTTMQDAAGRQDLSRLAEMVASGNPEALVVIPAVNPGQYGVALFESGSVTGDADDPDSVEIAFNITEDGGMDDPAGPLYALLSGSANGAAVFPAAVSSGIGILAILEEYRFYIRDTEDGRSPRLSMAKMYPNTQVPYEGLNENLQLDLASNVWDLQVALGFDSGYYGAFDDDDDYDGTDDLLVDLGEAGDDWLYNNSSDDPTDTIWTGPWPTSDPFEKPELKVFRLTTLTRADRPEVGYQAPILDAIEDRVYSIAFDDPFNGNDGRRYRRILLQTIVDPRNY